MTPATIPPAQPAPTSTGIAAESLQPAAIRAERKPAMPGLTGIRTCLALTIILFHFTPAGLRWPAHPWVSLYPIVDIGYVFVSFFFLISGFVLSYNYGGRPEPVRAKDFWMARFSRLYPVYIFTLLVSVPFLLAEYQVRSHTQFWEGAILTPLLLQGWFPMLATFWNTVTWTLSCDVMLYLAFPWIIRMRWPRHTGTLVAMIVAFWIVGLIPHSIYILRNPDHLNHWANRFDTSFDINLLKYTPLPYICTFFAGLTLGRVQDAVHFTRRGRNLLGLIGFAGALVAAYQIAPRVPYLLVHGGLFTPVFACIILALSGPSVWSTIFSTPPLITIGTSTYCLYLLHFNVFILLHQYHVPERLHVQRFDPWISYLAVVLLAIAVRKFLERPCQQLISAWWKRRNTLRQASEHVSSKASAV